MKGLFGFIFGIILTFGVNASMITFYVIETGLPESSDRNRHALLLEDALMDVFFDSGHIVTNAPILRLSSKPTGGIVEAARVRVSDAVESGSDYILVVMIDFNSDPNGPYEISFYAFRISNPQIIYQKQVTRRNGRTERDELFDLKSVVRDIVPFFNN
jgi:hypothetical protein